MTDIYRLDFQLENFLHVLRQCRQQQEQTPAETEADTAHAIHGWTPQHGEVGRLAHLQIGGQ